MSTSVNPNVLEQVPPVPPRPKRTPSPKILRFARSERMLHWAIAGPFLFSMATALVLVLVYNPDPSRPYRGVFAKLHRGSGVALIVLPMLAAVKSRGDARLHFYNIKQAWIWMFDDFKWLALMGLAAVNSKIQLPEQGKFNAAEKINFMVLMVTYPLYVATGLLMWLTPLAILSWLMHFLMACMAAPLIGGHLYMAVINPASRKGLHGMISGHVDRHWARHHYRRWYREHHEHTEHLPEESDEQPDAPLEPLAAANTTPAGVRGAEATVIAAVDGNGSRPRIPRSATGGASAPRETPPRFLGTQTES